jgi:hypothetical protein
MMNAIRHSGDGSTADASAVDASTVQHSGGAEGDNLWHVRSSGGRFFRHGQVIATRVCKVSTILAIASSAGGGKWQKATKSTRRCAHTVCHTNGRIHSPFAKLDPRPRFCTDLFTCVCRCHAA